MRRRLRLTFLTGICLASAAGAQVTSPAPAERQATVRGTVVDSLRGQPLRGAEVRLSPRDSALAAPRAARTDSAGRYAVAGIVPGAYRAFLAHPALDSLGLAAAGRPVDVVGGEQRLDLAIPSGRTLAALTCPDGAGGDSAAVVVGHIVDAELLRPVAGATVTATWSDWSALSLGRRVGDREVSTESGRDGWFALCDVPVDVPMLLRANAGQASSGWVRIEARERSVYPARFSIETDSTAGSVTSRARAAGIVRDATNRPVTGARVSLWGVDREAVTGERGTFVLDSVPAGTQTLEVRALGFEPVQQVVHLASSRPANVSVRLAERITALPEVAVRAAASASLRVRQFNERLRDAERGINRGFLFTAEEIEKRGSVLSDVFVTVPGITVLGSSVSPRKRVIFGPLRQLDGSLCRMTIYLDGIRVVGGLSSDSGEAIDEMVHAAEVLGVEVYPRAVGAPPQYQSLNGTCGIILIWTK